MEALPSIFRQNQSGKSAPGCSLPMRSLTFAGRQCAKCSAPLELRGFAASSDPIHWLTKVASNGLLIVAGEPRHLSVAH